MSELFEMQARFSSMVARLIIFAESQGYRVTFGEAQRSKQEAARLAAAGIGKKNSLHCDRLAVDLMLFKDGRYLTQSEDYLPLGLWWEGEGGAWGGRFNDGNHFSLAYGGRK